MDIHVLAGDGIDPEIKPAICASLTRPARAFALDLRVLWLPIGLASLWCLLALTAYFGLAICMCVALTMPR